MHGLVELQDWAPPSSAETRLIISREDVQKTYAVRKEYSVQDYENRMYYYNNIVRDVIRYALPFDNSLPNPRDPKRPFEKVPKLKGTYDALLEISIWTEYLLSKEPFASRLATLSADPNFAPFLENFIIYNMNEVSRSIGRDLNGDDISRGVTAKLRTPFKPSLA